MAIGLGIVLRVWQWAAQTTMWLDEIWLARNIRDRGMLELLTEPLADRQMAPPGFLASVELSTVILGMSEAALRLIPMLASVLALVLLWRVASRFLQGVPLAAVLLIAAASPALIWYAGNVKQYSSDVALSLLLVLLGLRWLEAPRDRPRALVAGGAGLVAVLFSHAAVLTAFALGCVLALRALRGRREFPLRPLASMLGMWALGAGVAAWMAVSFTSPEVREHMRGFWSDGLAPWGEGPIAVALWIPERLFNTLAHFLVFLDEPFGVLAAPLALGALVGLPVLWRRYGVRGAVLLTPVLGALFGAIAVGFPMDHRVGVHAGAPLVIVALVGLDAWASRTPRWSRAVALIVGVLAVVPMPLIVLLQSRPPIRAPDPLAVMESMASRMSAGDRVLAYCYAAPAAEYYGSVAGIEDFESLECAESERDLADRIEAIPPGRVWFLYTDTPEPVMYERALQLLGERGSELERVDDPYAAPEAAGAGAVLFEVAAPD